LILEIGEEMRNAFDDPKMFSVILRDQKWMGNSSVANLVAEQRSAAACLGLDLVAEQRSAAACLGLDLVAEQRSAAAPIAADLFAIRSAGTGVHISDALAAAKLANTSFAQLIHDVGETVEWKDLAGVVSKDWLREMDLGGTKMMAAATGVALKSHDEWKGLLGGVSKDWLREMDLGTKMMAAVTGVALKSHVINIADLSLQAEGLLSSLSPDGLGLTLSLSDEARIALTSSFIDFSHSYRGLVESFEASPASLLSLGPRLSRLPAVEYYNGAVLSRSVSVQEDNEEGNYSHNEIVETGDVLHGFLVRLNPRLVPIRDGARKALDSRNPDRVRHFSSSYRELLTHVLYALAPDDGIRRWSASPEHYHNKRPTRKARLLYISRLINQTPFETFVDNDIAAVLEHFELLNGGTHGIDPQYTDAQLRALQTRIEGAITFLFEISQTE
jgi:hypothetical protein